MWRSNTWRPNSIPSFSGVRRFARFGGGVTGFNILNFAMRNGDNLLIARLAGSAQLGLYDRSYKLMMMPLQSLNGPISLLLMPMLSKMQEDPERFRRTFIFAARSVGLITIPGIAVAAALSERLMPFLLGDRWAGAGTIFFWLGLAGLFNPIGNLTGLLFITSARTGPFFRWGVFSAVVTLTGFAFGIRWGAEGVAASLFITTALRTPFLFSYSVGQTGVKSLDLYGAQFEPMIASALGVAAALKLAPYFSTGPLLCIAFAITYLLAGVGAASTSSGRNTVRKMAEVLRDLAETAGSRLQKQGSAGPPS
jgi:PST family polysaccharide transporter